ncbi:MAG: hypothetical protein IJ811_00355 [Clostridia bacterium]|nr:hypothetical protein [Clostridia bacterium]
MTQKENEKKLFVEVGVDLLYYPGDKVMTASTTEGTYDDLDNWGGLDEIW